jgi:hypothetical protein
MTQLEIGSRLVALIFPISAILAAACSDPKSGTPGGSSGGLGGSGGMTTGGTNPGTGGMATGGANATGGAIATGGTNATGGVIATGGTTSAGAGGSATGGSNAGSGGLSTGGTGAGSGGGGGATAGTGGAGAGGAGKGGTGGSSSGPMFHVFMLMGQSNMAGVAPREASDANTDQRLKVLGGCNQPAGQWNTVTNPPLNDCPGEKGWNLSNAVDPGIWFGKTLLARLPAGDTIGLVGTAESGESINTFVSGGSHHQMILRKIGQAKTAPNARFAGVIFHQGESDSGQSTWPGKVVQLYNEVKAAWGVNFDVPFILGELPAGGCCSGHNNLVHQAADMLPMGYWVSQQGTGVMDQYHFDHASVILMGQRYGETMIDALDW